MIIWYFSLQNTDHASSFSDARCHFSHLLQSDLKNCLSYLKSPVCFPVFSVLLLTLGLVRAPQWWKTAAFHQEAKCVSVVDGSAPL